MDSGIQWPTMDDRCVHGVTGGDRDLQWHTGSVYRGAQGITGYKRALNSDTQGMYRG